MAKCSITVAEFVRLHELWMANLEAHDFLCAPEFEAQYLWFLDHNLACAYGEIEETKDNRPDFIIEWEPFVGPMWQPVYDADWNIINSRGDAYGDD